MVRSGSRMCSSELIVKATSNRLGRSSCSPSARTSFNSIELRRQNSRTRTCKSARKSNSCPNGSTAVTWRPLLARYAARMQGPAPTSSTSTVCGLKDNKIGSTRARPKRASLTQSSNIGSFENIPEENRTRSASDNSCVTDRSLASQPIRLIQTHLQLRDRGRQRAYISRSLELSSPLAVHRDSLPTPGARAVIGGVESMHWLLDVVTARNPG